MMQKPCKHTPNPNNLATSQGPCPQVADAQGWSTTMRTCEHNPTQTTLTLQTRSHMNYQDSGSRKAAYNRLAMTVSRLDLATLSLVSADSLSFLRRARSRSSTCSITSSTGDKLESIMQGGEHADSGRAAAASTFANAADEAALQEPFDILASLHV